MNLNHPFPLEGKWHNPNVVEGVTLTMYRPDLRCVSGGLVETSEEVYWQLVELLTMVGTDWCYMERVFLDNGDGGCEVLYRLKETGVTVLYRKHRTSGEHFYAEKLLLKHL